jgi:GNAT superfamily N-acetyltransferase
VQATSAPLRARRNTSITIDEASESDIPALVQLKQQVVSEAYGELYPKEQVERWIENNANDKHFNYRIGRSGYKVFVARDDKGQPLAVGTMRRRGNRADMSGLYVLQRGQGLGTKIAKAREAYAKQIGCTRTRVSVFRTNTPAQKFILGRGFAKTSGGFREPTFGVRVDHYERDL